MKKRRVNWFNPPYNVMAKNNIGVAFKQVLRMHIPKHHKLYPVINEHTTKLSYSMMASMGSKIGAHNSQVERDNEVKDEARKYSCPKTKKGSLFKCHWEGNCLQEGGIYKCKGLDTKTEDIK